MNPKNKIRVVASVIQNESKYLICQRPVGKRHGGMWEFPGGKIKDGEVYESAIRRELKEELDLEVAVVGEKLYEILDNGSNFIIEFYKVSVKGSIKLLEHSNINWLESKELLQLPLAPSDYKFVKNILTKNGLNNV